MCAYVYGFHLSTGVCPIWSASFQIRKGGRQEPVFFSFFIFFPSGARPLITLFKIIKHPPSVSAALATMSALRLKKRCRSTMSGWLMAMVTICFRIWCTCGIVS